MFSSSLLICLPNLPFARYLPHPLLRLISFDVAVSMDAISVQKAKGILVTFFKEWLAVSEDDIQVKPMTNGFSNIVALVRRRDASGNQLTQPNQVIIRLYGGNMFWNSKPKEKRESSLTNFFDHKNDQTEETLIVYQLSKKGYGPKVYGVFSGGRVDEYIPSHTLKHEELHDDRIIKDLAVNYARLNGLRLPLQNKIHIVDQRIKEKLLANPKDYSDIVKDIFTPEIVSLLHSLDIDAQSLQSFDYKQEWGWIFEMRKRIRSRKVMSSYDCNFLNVLVRDDAVSKEGDESVIVLIDHEATLIGYRSQCIGCHFMNWMLKWKSTTDKKSGRAFPNQQQRRTFITEYLKEQKRLAYIPDFDEGGFDSVDKVMMEADFGLLNAIMYSTFGLLAEIPGFVLEDPSFLRAILFLQQFYRQHKKESIELHGW